MRSYKKRRGRRPRHGRPPVRRGAAFARRGRRWQVTVLAEEADAAYDRVGLTGYTEHWDRALLALPGNDYRRRRPASSCGSAAGSTDIDRDAKSRDDRRRRAHRLRRAGAGHRLLRVRAAGARTRPAALPRLPHPRRPRRDPRRRASAPSTRGTPVGRGDRRWPARTGGRQRAAPVRAARPRRRDGAAADGPAARRGRRRAAGPDDQRPGHHRAHRRRHRSHRAGTTQSARPAVRRATTRCG